MGLDIRLPIGIMFSLVGALLVLAGFIGDPKQLERSLNINVNLYWGSFLVVFGLSMLIASMIAKKKQENQPKS